MAEGTSGDYPIMICPHFLHSTCRDGDRCQFSHDISANSLRPKNIPCFFFLRGPCIYGNKCWYSHDFQKNSIFLSHGNEGLQGLSYQSTEDVVSESDSNQLSQISNQSEIDRQIIKPRYSFERHYQLRKANKTSVSGPSKSRTYASVLNPNTDEENTKKLDMGMCQHFDYGICFYGDTCPCVHGQLCELCDKYCLDPTDEDQRKYHIEMCEKFLEEDMEYSFAIQYSQDKTCNICLEVVLDKTEFSERKFGILENCDHVFCLSCINKWRQQTNLIPEDPRLELTRRVTRSCPVCRKQSNFVTPSYHWFDSEESKQKLITQYKVRIGNRHCKYFKRGASECPFGGKCFYLHAKPDGTKVELPPPTRRMRQNEAGGIEEWQAASLWDFIDDRDIAYNLDVFDGADFNG